MNKRARNRLIGITAIIVLGILAVVFTLGTQNAAYNKTVQEAIGEKPGTRIKVGGIVVNGSWNKQTNPMRFEIRDENDSDGTGPTMTVVYTGTTVPSTFGDGVTAIVTGTIEEDGSIRSDEMITKCPSKYESSSDAYSVAQLKDKASAMAGVPLKVAGYIKDSKINPPGSAVRFILIDESGATTELNVAASSEVQIPSEAEEAGSKLVITGELDQNGLFTAVDISIEKK